MLWDAAAVLTATGQALFFDALNPGVVVPGVKGRRCRQNHGHTAATLSIAGFQVESTFNLWPRSGANLERPPTSPGQQRRAGQHLGERATFSMVRSAKAEGANCLASAMADVTIDSLDSVEMMDVSVHGLPPETEFDFFVIQLPNTPFGLAWYQGDIKTDKQGEGHQKFMGRFSDETFSVAQGSGPTPVIHHDAIPDAIANPPTKPVHQFHRDCGSTLPRMPSRRVAPVT